MNRTKIKSEKDSDHEESVFNVLGERGDQPRRSRRIRDLYGDSDNESEDNSSKNGRDPKGKDLEPDSDEEDDTFAIAWGAFGLADSEDENHEVTETAVIDSDEEFRDDNNVSDEDQVEPTTHNNSDEPDDRNKNYGSRTDTNVSDSTKVQINRAREPTVAPRLSSQT